jgi:hypothetical protein
VAVVVVVVVVVVVAVVVAAAEMVMVVVTWPAVVVDMLIVVVTAMTVMVEAVVVVAVAAVVVVAARDGGSGGGCGGAGGRGGGGGGSGCGSPQQSVLYKLQHFPESTISAPKSDLTPCLENVTQNSVSSDRRTVQLATTGNLTVSKLSNYYCQRMFINFIPSLAQHIYESEFSTT